MSAGHAARQAERDYERDKRLRESTDVASPVSEQALEARRLEEAFPEINRGLEIHVAPSTGIDPPVTLLRYSFGSVPVRKS